MLSKPNVLVFDEPTNHLDLESINALNVALQKYEGTVFLVTHDHDLIDEVGDPDLALPGRRHRRLQGSVRRVRGSRRKGRSSGSVVPDETVRLFLPSAQNRNVGHACANLIDLDLEICGNFLHLLQLCLNRSHVGSQFFDLCRSILG